MIGEIIHAFGETRRVTSESMATRTYDVPGEGPRTYSYMVQGTVLIDAGGREIADRKAAPQPPVAACLAAPSHEGVGRREVAAAAPEAKVGQARETSLEAYDELKASGKLSRQQQIVVAALRSGKADDYTRQELVKLSGLPINAVCGRVDELRAEPILMVEETQKRRCLVTGETAMALRLRSLA